MRAILLLICLGFFRIPTLAGSLSPVQLSTPSRNVGQQLGRIQVKHLNYRNAQVTDVIEQLADMAREADPPVNIVMHDLEKARAPLNLELRNKSLREILLLVCKVADLHIEVRNGIVFIGEPEE